MSKIDVLAFGKLHFLFAERNWPIPMTYEMAKPLTAAELCKELKIPAEDVEVVFINRVIKPLSTVLKTGDRIAFVPPGVPSIHRFNLGFYEVKEKSR
jgi:sulfur carrier protein ThiS